MLVCLFGYVLPAAAAVPVPVYQSRLIVATSHPKMRKNDLCVTHFPHFTERERERESVGARASASSRRGIHLFRAFHI